MKKLVFVMLFSILGKAACYGQLNNYKYLIVPAKFNGFKNENQFRTSTLVKYLFTNEGFNVVYDNRLPSELEENPCLGARVELIDESGLLQTKTALSVKDCHGVVLMTSQLGRTRTKDMEQAYREAISESFGSFRGLNYEYNPNQKEEKSEAPVTVSFANDIKSLETENKAEIEKVEEKEVPMESPEVVEVETEEAQPIVKEKGILYAQPVEGGYQLVDTTPKVVYVLKATSAPDVFIVNKDGKSGVVYKNEGKWFIEMDEKGGKSKELNIKF